MSLMKFLFNEKILFLMRKTQKFIEEEFSSRVTSKNI